MKTITFELEFEKLEIKNCHEAGVYAKIEIEEDLLFAALSYEDVRKHYEMRIEREIYDTLCRRGVVKDTKPFDEWLEKEKFIRDSCDDIGRLKERIGKSWDEGIEDFVEQLISEGHGLPE